MNSKQSFAPLATLRDRFGISLDTEGWEGRELPGGAGLTDDAVASLALAARQFDDRSAVAYEMESSNKAFPPLQVSLDRRGFVALRRSMLSHFDLVLIPPSRKWALVMSHELDGVVLGPKQFLTAI